MLKTFFSLSVTFVLFFSLSAVSEGAEDCAKAQIFSKQAQRFINSQPSIAEQKLRQAIDLCYRSASLQYNLAMALYRQKDYDKAIERLEEAIRINPEYAKAMNALSYIITMNEGDPEKALELAQKATTLDPINDEYLETLNEAIISNVDMPPPSPTVKKNAKAVVIGNKNYDAKDIPMVDYAWKDAEVIRKYLISTMGFSPDNVILKKDVSYMDIVKIFGDTRDHRGRLYNQTVAFESDIFIYYSGHGAPDTESNKAYLIPSDADPFNIKLTSYSIDTLYANLQKLSKERKPKSITVVLDACFSGGAHKGKVVQVASPIYLDVKMPLVTDDRTVIFSSSQPKQISSWYPEKKHSLFTYYFLKGIKKAVMNNIRVTPSNLEKYLKNVTNAARKKYGREQTPQVMGNKNIVLVNK